MTIAIHQYMEFHSFVGCSRAFYSLRYHRSNPLDLDSISNDIVVGIIVQLHHQG